MNHTITLNGLVARFALELNLSPEEASEFVTAFFETIETALSEAENVSIKGLGTFTPGKGIVEFQPEESFAKKVNAAFEMFSPVILPDDYTEPETEDTKDIIESPTPDFPDEDTEKISETITESDEHDNHKLEEIQGVVAIEEESSEVTHVVTEPAETDEKKDDITSDDNNDTNTNDITDLNWQNEDNRRSGHRCCVALFSIIFLIVGLIGGIVVGYLFHDDIYALISDKKGILNIATEESERLHENEDKEAIDTLKVDLTETDILDVNNPLTDPEQNIWKPALPPHPKYDTIGTHRFLATMAKQYYGNSDYWVYIYQANASKLKHPDRIKPGSQVVIPDFNEFKTSNDSIQNLKDAQKLGIEIYARYK